MCWQNILTIIILDNMNIVSRLKYITRVVFALKDSQFVMKNFWREKTFVITAYKRFLINVFIDNAL